MARRIIVTRAWCDEDFGECWQSYDENTSQHKHIGASTSDLAAEMKRLESLGYSCRHRSGMYTFTLRKSSPLIPLPLDWQMAQESKEPEYIQDW